MLRELLPREERRPVDAGQHLTVLVAAPVGAGDRVQLERLDPPRRGPVRPAAQVHEGTVAVERDGLDALVADEVLDQLHLVRLVLGAKALDRLGGGDLASARTARPPRRGPPSAARSARGRTRRAEPVGELEVVVEAVGDRRPDRHLRPRPQIEDGRGQHVGCVVAEHVERVCAPGSQDLDLARRRPAAGQVADLAVDANGERVLRQPRPDGGRRVGAGRPLLERQG